MAYIINDNCTNCGVCVAECPTDCIKEGDPIYVIVAEDCVDCGACAVVCPAEACVEA